MDEGPDWYSAWRHEAVHQLRDKIDRLKAEFRLAQWPRYDFDLDAGTLTFSEEGIPKVIAEIQIAGTTSVEADDWLWAWANSHWPSERATASEIVRVFGKEHGICELTHSRVEGDDLNSLGWRLTAVMARLTDAIGAYRAPRDEGGALFLVCKSVVWAG